LARLIKEKDGVAVLPLMPAIDNPGVVTLELPDDLGLSAAPTLVESLREAFNHYSSVVVAAPAVARVSTAAVQALVAASRQATANGQHFVITNPSDVLTDMCADLGLGSWLDDWSDQ
jgi:anti-anti-sigma regulatory factor